jgi:hypothetical protein
MLVVAQLARLGFNKLPDKERDSCLPDWKFRSAANDPSPSKNKKERVKSESCH